MAVGLKCGKPSVGAIKVFTTKALDLLRQRNCFISFARALLPLVKCDRAQNNKTRRSTCHFPDLSVPCLERAINEQHWAIPGASQARAEPSQPGCAPVGSLGSHGCDSGWNPGQQTGTWSTKLIKETWLFQWQRNPWIASRGI